MEDEDSLPESRLFLGNIATNLIGSSLFNNRFSPVNQFRPFANLLNRIPPNTANSRSAFDACTSPAGEAGICTMSSVCSLFAGRPSGSCSLSRVCCVSKSNKTISYEIRFILIFILSKRCGQWMWENGYLKQHVLAIASYGKLSFQLCADY